MSFVERDVIVKGLPGSKEFEQQRLEVMKEVAINALLTLASPEGAVLRMSPKGLMKKFKGIGLKYDAYTEPLPGYGYHQWTLYGEGPAKGATFGTKTTELSEMEKKLSELFRKFSGE
jgi:hypothetical protein